MSKLTAVDHLAVRRGYTRLATLLLGTVIAFGLLNGLVAVWELWPREMPEVAHYGIDRLAKVYPGMTPDEIRRLLWETYADDRRNLVYEQVTQFKEAPYRGRYVNVDEAGFRIGRDQGPWPPDPEAFNVFVLGGSTTFGYGLPDDVAIPSQIQELAAAAGCERPPHLYNFGRANYFSTQEELLFQTLLSAGIVPSAAIFVDGLNEFYFADDDLTYTRELTLMMADRTPRQWAGVVADWPLVRLASQGLARLRPAPPRPDLRDPATLDRLIGRWARNRALAESVGARFGVPLLFVLQPIPTYGYDLRQHLFYRDEPDYFGAFQRSGYAYERLEARRAELEQNGNVLWLADVQKGRRENLYVDFVHYNAPFASELAGAILDRLVRRRIAPCRSGG